MEYTGAGIITTFKIKYDGAEISDYHNNHAEVARDATVASLLPEEICPCALNRAREPTCLRPEILIRVAKKLGIPTEQTHRIEELMHSLLQKTHCNNEKCVLDVAQKLAVISVEEAGIEEQIAFKQNGPIDAALLNDSVIQAQLYAWMYQFRDLWAYNFNMLNYTEKSLRHGHVVNEPDTLATIKWIDLYAGRIPHPVGMRPTAAAQKMLAEKARGVRRSCCIVNSDSYDGNGKHWMALFVDASAPPGDPSHPWTIEFFNSAAVRPESEWLEWMARTRLELQKCATNAKIAMVYVCKVWHQHSKSECGVYSLFYIWARLNGIPAQYFLDNVVPDQIMFEFRQHLFNTSDIGTPFDFTKFAGQVKIRWDSEDISGNKKRTNI